MSVLGNGSQPASVPQASIWRTAGSLSSTNNHGLLAKYLSNDLYTSQQGNDCKCCLAFLFKQVHTKHREGVDLCQLLNPKQNKVKLHGWAFQNVGQFLIVNLDYLENFKQQANSLNFFKNNKFKFLKKIWKVEKLKKMDIDCF